MQTCPSAPSHVLLSVKNALLPFFFGCPTPARRTGDSDQLPSPPSPFVFLLKSFKIPPHPSHLLLVPFLALSLCNNYCPGHSELELLETLDRISIKVWVGRILFISVFPEGVGMD